VGEEPNRTAARNRRLSWLTNSALIYEPKRGWSQPMSAAVNMEPNKQDLTPYLTYGRRHIADFAVGYIGDQFGGEKREPYYRFANLRVLSLRNEGG
jgi:hypothetical protein